MSLYRVDRASERQRPYLQGEILLGEGGEGGSLDLATPNAADYPCADLRSLHLDLPVYDRPSHRPATSIHDLKGALVSLLFPSSVDHHRVPCAQLGLPIFALPFGSLLSDRVQTSFGACTRSSIICRVVLAGGGWGGQISEWSASLRLANHC